MSTTNLTSSQLSPGNVSLLEIPLNESMDMAPEFVASASFLFLLIFVMGFLGNLMFCYIVISSPAMKTVTNYFLVNLSVADLLISVFCTLNQAILFLSGSFPFGRVMCYILVMIQPTAVFSSSFTLVVISIERYVNILHPLKPRMKTSHSKIVIVFIWIVACLSSCPDVYIAQYMEESGGQCTVNPGSPWAKVYHAIVLVIQYVIPVMIMLYSYSMMVFTIWKRRDFLESQSNPSQPNNQMQNRKTLMIKSKKKMVKMLIVVVTVYSLAYFPLNIVWLILGQVAEHTEMSENGYGNIFAYIHTVFLFLALSHVCYNPLIYFWMNIRIRYGFIDLFGKIPGIRKCFPNVAWDSPFSRKETVSRYVGFTRQSSNTSRMRLSDTRMSRLQSNRSRDDSCIELQELCDAEPLMMKAVLSNEVAKRHKTSVTSITTETSEIDMKLTNGVTKRGRPRTSNITLPDLQMLDMEDITEEKQSDLDKE